MASEGSLRAFWRGNGANVVKNIPEMGLKLGAADYARQAFSVRTLFCLQSDASTLFCLQSDAPHPVLQHCAGISGSHDCTELWPWPLDLRCPIGGSAK